MNKTLTVAAIAAAIMLAACKKDYVCTCRVQSPADTNNQVIMAALDSTTIVDITNVKKSDADGQCKMTTEYLDQTFNQYRKRSVNCKLND